MDAGIQSKDKDDQPTDDDCREEQQLHSGEKVVGAEAEIVRRLTVDAVREEHECEGKGDGNGER